MQSTEIHPFERAGLGRAPFTCIGVDEIWFEMPGFGRKPGGSCAYCGTGILNAFKIRSADGACFVVGCDCVEKTGPVAEFRAVRLAAAADKRAKRVAGRRIEREARWKAEAAERRALKAEAWGAANADLAAELAAYAGENEFVRSMRQAVDTWGGLTQGQTDAVRATLATEARIQRQRANSRHVGKIAKRMNVRARVVFSKVLYSQQFPSIIRCITVFETEAGDSLVWFSSDRWAPTEEFFEIRFTPSAHDQRDGIAQTIIQRVSEVLTPAMLAAA